MNGTGTIHTARSDHPPAAGDGTGIDRFSKCIRTIRYAIGNGAILFDKKFFVGKRWRDNTMLKLCFELPMSCFGIALTMPHPEKE
jgi:hypothetical protein